MRVRIPLGALPLYHRPQQRQRGSGTLSLMRHFRVFSGPTGDLQVVKLGWSWPAFCFGLFWLAYKRLWGIAIGSVFLVFVIAFIESAATVPENTAFTVVDLVGILIAVLLGGFGNVLLASRLTQKGYTKITVVEAKNPKHATEIVLETRQT